MQSFNLSEWYRLSHEFYDCFSQSHWFEAMCTDAGSGWRKFRLEIWLYPSTDKVWFEPASSSPSVLAGFELMKMRLTLRASSGGQYSGLEILAWVLWMRWPAAWPINFAM